MSALRTSTPNKSRPRLSLSTYPLGPGYSSAAPRKHLIPGENFGSAKALRVPKHRIDPRRDAHGRCNGYWGIRSDKRLSGGHQGRWLPPSPAANLHVLARQADREARAQLAVGGRPDVARVVARGSLEALRVVEDVRAPCSSHSFGLGGRRPRDRGTPPASAPASGRGRGNGWGRPGRPRASPRARGCPR